MTYHILEVSFYLSNFRYLEKMARKGRRKNPKKISKIVGVMLVVTTKTQMISRIMPKPTIDKTHC